MNFLGLTTDKSHLKYEWVWVEEEDIGNISPEMFMEWLGDIGMGQNDIFFKVITNFKSSAPFSDHVF